MLVITILHRFETFFCPTKIYFNMKKKKVIYCHYIYIYNNNIRTHKFPRKWNKNYIYVPFSFSSKLRVWSRKRDYPQNHDSKKNPPSQKIKRKIPKKPTKRSKLSNIVCFYIYKLDLLSWLWICWGQVSLVSFSFEVNRITNNSNASFIQPSLHTFLASVTLICITKSSLINFNYQNN